jgi:ribosome biogenesis GTPase A
MSARNQFGNHLPLKQAIERAELVRDTLLESGDQAAAAKLSDNIASARQMKFAIGVVGQAKRGKSTFINGVLGRRDDVMAPVGRFPATNVVSCFASGPQENIKVIFLSDAVKTISVAEIKHYACEEFNPGNQKAVKVIEIIAPFPNLSTNVVLVDTPGADNALSDLHDIVLIDYLPRLDAVVFLVTADAPLTESEMTLLKHVRSCDVKKLFFAVNKVDKVEPDELTEGIAHNRSRLAEAGFGDAEIFPISAKNFQANGADDGSERLIYAIQELIGGGRAAAIAERLGDLAERYAEEAQQKVSSELALCEKSEEQVRAEKTELLALRESLSKTRPGLERRFRTSWRSAFGAFEDALPIIERQMIAEYNELIERTSPMQIADLGKTIHADVLKRLDELMEPQMAKIRNDLGEAIHALQVDFSGSFGLTPTQAEAIVSTKGALMPAVDVATATAPSLIGAFAVGALPGLVASVISGVAPTAVAATLNPFTWLPALGTGAAAGAAGVAAGVVSLVLAPLAAIGVPLLIGLAGYRGFSTWKSKVAESKNHLSLAVKDLILGVITETRRNMGQLRRKDEEIVNDFIADAEARLESYQSKLEALIQKRPDSDHVAQLRQSLLLLEQMEPAKRLASSAEEEETPRRLFSTEG